MIQAEEASDLDEEASDLVVTENRKHITSLNEDKNLSRLK